jgi:hypothetical protein
MDTKRKDRIMNASRYTREELTKTARTAVKGRGTYRRWELQIMSHGTYDVVSLVVTFTCKQDGCTATTSVRL